MIGAFTSDDGGFTLANLRALGDEYILDAFVRSILLSAVTAVVGAVLGAMLAYALATASKAGCYGGWSPRPPRRPAAFFSRSPFRQIDYLP